MVKNRALANIFPPLETWRSLKVATVRHGHTLPPKIAWVIVHIAQSLRHQNDIFEAI